MRKGKMEKRRKGGKERRKGEDKRKQIAFLLDI